MDRSVIIVAVALMLGARPVCAQSEGGLLLSAGAEKKVNKQLSVGVEADYRTRNDFKTADRWSIALGGDYKLTKGLKADVGYTLLNSNFREKLTYSSATKGRWRPSYWGVRHRFHASLTANRKLWRDLRVSVRERWQYTYRPSKDVERWKLDPSAHTMALDDDYVRSGKGKNQLRSRLQLSWDKKRALLTPYASAEFYHSWAIEKVRYTVGTDIRLSKRHELTVYYRFQDMHNVDEDDFDPDMHYLGLGYQFKF